MQPLILVESKYIRYKKHNRDKGSWICTAHSAIRRRYKSVRSSIAVLAGSWSQSSVTMMRSHDITIFMIPFDSICDLLAEYDVDFRWEEKEREKTIAAWQDFQKLTEVDKAQLGQSMIRVIERELRQRIIDIVSDSVEREIDKIVLEIVSNLGEVSIFEFATVVETIEFLEKLDVQTAFIIRDSLTLYDEPPNLN